MDSIKQQVCDEVRSACKHLVVDDDNGGEAEYEATWVTDLETMLQFPTPHGTRYFSVIVRERM